MPLAGDNYSVNVAESVKIWVLSPILPDVPRQQLRLGDLPELMPAAQLLELVGEVEHETLESNRGSYAIPTSALSVMSDVQLLLAEIHFRPRPSGAVICEFEGTRR